MTHFESVMAQEAEVEEIVVTSTRSRRSFERQPTRVEVLGGEEINEKANMKPGDIRMLLNESTGIHVQQTSATSFNSSIRIQGLDGKYTQILKDGLPLYAGFSGGLSLLQIVPLDLEQVEVILQKAPNDHRRKRTALPLGVTTHRTGQGQFPSGAGGILSVAGAWPGHNILLDPQLEMA